MLQVWVRRTAVAAGNRLRIGRRSLRQLPDPSRCRRSGSCRILGPGLSRYLSRLEPLPEPVPDDERRLRGSRFRAPADPEAAGRKRPESMSSMPPSTLGTSGRPTRLARAAASRARRRPEQEEYFIARLSLRWLGSLRSADRLYSRDGRAVHGRLTGSASSPCHRRRKGSPVGSWTRFRLRAGSDLSGIAASRPKPTSEATRSTEYEVDSRRC